MRVCCEQMKVQLEDERATISYLPRYRSYSIDVIDWYMPKEEIVFIKDIITAKQNVTYCPWCGEKLPNNLSDKWFEVLEEEHDLKSPLDNKRKIPKEFLTDEWWKKRGL